MERRFNRRVDEFVRHLIKRKGCRFPLKDHDSSFKCFHSFTANLINLWCHRGEPHEELKAI